MKNKRKRRKMTFKQIATLTGVIILGSALAFGAFWTQQNWDGITSFVTGSYIYTSQDLQNAADDAYEQAFEDYEAYQTQIADYSEQILALTTARNELQLQVDSLTTSGTISSNQVTALEAEIAQLDAELVEMQTSLESFQDIVNTYFTLTIAQLDSVADEVKVSVSDYDMLTELNGYAIYGFVNDVEQPGQMVALSSYDGTYTFDTSALAVGDHEFYVEVRDLSDNLFMQSNTLTIARAELLAAPAVTVNGTNISWNAVDGAESYLIDMGELQFETTALTYDLTDAYFTLFDADLFVNYISGTVQAKSTAVDGVRSVDFVLDGSAITQLTKPTNYAISGSAVSWDAVTGADNYKVYLRVEGVVTYELIAETTNHFIDLTDYLSVITLLDTDGNDSFSISVQATGEGSLPSYYKNAIYGDFEIPYVNFN